VPGGKKSTIESLAETPVSRRQILKSTASQAGQAMLPQSLIHEATNLVPKVAEPLGPLQSSVPMASQMSVHEMLPGIIARGIDKGLNDQELVDYVLKHTNNHPEVEDQLVDNLATQITNPESEQEHEFDISRPGQALIDILDPQGGIYTDSVYRLRPTLRYLKSQSPEIYQDTLNNARDISMGHIENLYEHHDVDPDLLKAWQEGKIDSWELAKQHFGETD
jgi:hypothetical protein